MQCVRSQQAGAIRRCHWRCSTSTYSNQLCYAARQFGRMLQRHTDVIIDKHAPFAGVKPRALVNDRTCQLAKADTGRLERIYRRDKSAANRDDWHRQLDSASRLR